RGRARSISRRTMACAKAGCSSRASASSPPTSSRIVGSSSAASRAGTSRTRRRRARSCTAARPSMPAPALRTASSLALLLALAGCASMNRNQCLNADWYAIGLEDGARGRAVERLGDHRRACAEYNVAPDTARYVAGRNEGLKSFCTYERGFSEGRAGNPYEAACPAPGATAFLAGYNRGRELHDLYQRRDEVQREIGRTKAALTEGI